MRVFTQDTWLGTARKTKLRDDARTSEYELNTQPGDNALKKIKGRKPYIDTGESLPHPAVRIDQKGQYWVAFDKDGNYKQDWGFNSASDSLSIDFCFKWDGQDEADTGRGYKLFSNYYGSYHNSYVWSLSLDYSSGWKLRFYIRGAGGTQNKYSSTEILPGQWYWFRFYAKSGDAVNLPTIEVYKNGSTTYEDQDVFASDITFADETGEYVIIGDHAKKYPNCVNRLSVAYASINDVDVRDYAGTTEPWYATLAYDGCYDTSQAYTDSREGSFLVFDPKNTVQPGRVKQTTGENVTWVMFPRHDIKNFTKTESGSSTPPYGKGLISNSHSSLICDWGHLEFFKNRTVFVFEVDFLNSLTSQHFVNSDSDSYYYIARAPDDSFKIYLKDDGLWCYLKVLWTPVNWTAGSVGQGYCSETISTNLGSSVSGCYAVEVVPVTDNTTENNIYLYEWTGTGWTDVTNASTAGEEGEGIKDVIGNKWTISEALGRIGILYDLKLFLNMPSDWDSSGDFDWPMVTSSYPKQLESWYSHYPDDNRVGKKKVKYFYNKQKGDIANQALALADRRTGDYIWKVNPYTGKPTYDACSHIKNGFKPKVEDIIPIEEGGLRILTDSYAYDYFPSGADQSSEAYPKINASTEGKQQWTSVGSHEYVTGSGPLQLVKDEAHYLGFYPPIVRSYPLSQSEATASKIDEGSLVQGTEQLYKVTLYNPLNGDESNPFGPWRFEVASSTGGVYAFVVDFELESPQDLSRYQIRVYRYYSSDGYYYLEGAANIGNAEVSSDIILHKARFTCYMSDTTLSGQTQLSYLKDNPPEHNCCIIWAGRAWYADVFSPSRVRFSEDKELGSCPPSNVIWTDEGLTGNILSFMPGFGGLLLLRERSIWMIPAFQNPGSVVAQPIIPDLGVVSPNAALFVKGNFYFASHDAIYVYNGKDEPVNLTERLDGIDQKIWGDVSNKTRSWYDRDNHKIVFACAGAALTIDTETSAISFMTTADTAYVHQAHSDYSGSLYGASGQIWQETDANKSLTLDSDGDRESSALTSSWTFSSSFTPTVLNWLYYDTSSDGSLQIGVVVDALLYYAGYQADSCPVGRSLIDYDTDTPIGWAVIVEMCLKNEGTEQQSTWFGRFERSLTGNECLFDILPFYYKSQRNYLGSKANAKRVQRFDLTLGGDGSTTGIDATVQVESQMYTENTKQSVSDTGSITDYGVLILPVRLKGNDFSYIISLGGKDNQAEIRTVRHHYQTIRPRGKVT